MIGFVLYRLLMRVDIPVGNTLPDMAATIVICIAANKSLFLQKLPINKAVRAARTVEQLFLFVRYAHKEVNFLRAFTEILLNRG